MGAAPFTIWQQGQAAVTAAWLNAVELTTDLVSDLLRFNGQTGQQVFCRGEAAVNDGLGGAFYWANGTGFVNDGVNVVVPSGTTSGAWLRLSASANDVSIVLPTIAALEAEAGLAGVVAFVQGYATLADGGGGFFQFNPAQVSVNNGGTVFNGWVRVYAGSLEAQWFGAFDAGPTSDASPGLQRAIAVAETTGQALHLGALQGKGFWLNSSALNCTNLNQLTITGDGPISPQFGLALLPSNYGSTIVGNNGTAILDATGSNNINLLGLSLSTLTTAGGHTGATNPSTVGVFCGTSTRGDAGSPGGANVNLRDCSIAMAHGVGAAQSFGFYGMSWNFGILDNVMVLADAPCVVAVTNPYSLTPPFGTLGSQIGSDGNVMSGCQFLCYGLNASVYPLYLEECTDLDAASVYMNTINGGVGFTGQAEAMFVKTCSRVTMTVEVDYLPTVFLMEGICDQISITGTTYPNLTPIASNLPLVGLFQLPGNVTNSIFAVTADAMGSLTNNNYWYTSIGGGSPPSKVWNNCSFLVNSAQSSHGVFLNTSSVATVPFFNLAINADIDSLTNAFEINGSAAANGNLRYYLNGILKGTG